MTDEKSAQEVDTKRIDPPLVGVPPPLSPEPPMSSSAKEAIEAVPGAFVLRNEPGALFRVLGHFALRDVNVKHLLARPAAARRLPELNGAEENANHWDYVYVFDWESELSRAESETLIDTLRQTCSGFRVLGQYPSFMDQKRFRTPEWQSTWDGSMVHTF